MNAGVEAYKSGRYAEAVSAFQKAVELNPGAIDARVHLGTVLFTQFIPGADSPQNRALAAGADEQFRRVLEIDPANKVALQAMASLTYQEAQGVRSVEEKGAKLREAADWYHRLTSIDPNNGEAWYSQGVIAWAQAYQPIQAARTAAGLGAGDPGPIPNAAVRWTLRSQYGQVIDDGMTNLQRALQIDPNYDDAMAYMNLLYRLKADFEDNASAWQTDTQMADEWVQRAIQIKKDKASGVVRKQYAGGGSTPFIPVPPPPPPPPPPPSAGGFSPGARGDFGAINFDPVPVTTPQRIRVGSNVQMANIINRVDPVYPPLGWQARISGVVRFTAVIGKDGTIQNLQLVSGHPLLIQPAQDAVKQWTFKPTLLNGQPVEVVTQLDVPFVLPGR